LARRTLLLADDSPTVQKVVQLTFADEGMQVVTASGGEEALARLAEAVPDVLLAAVHMPAPNGYELCARVKRDARTSHVPVLLLVGKFEDFDEAEARRAGADGVLTKQPFQSIRELVSKVGGLFGGHREEGEPEEAEREDVRAAGEEVSAAADDSFAPSPAEDVQPSPAFAGLDADDESIETVAADRFVAAGRARAEEAAEFVAAHAPSARGAAGSVSEIMDFETATGVAEASAVGSAARTHAAHAAAHFAAPQSDRGFAPRAPQPAPEDSLLELGEPDPPQSRGAADFDDLILDIGDDTDAPDARMGEADSADVFGLAAADAGAEGGQLEAAEISPANLSNAWSDAPRIEVPPARATFTEPSIEEAPAAESAEPELAIDVETEAEPVAAPVSVGSAEAQDAPQAAGAAGLTEAAYAGVAESRTEISEPPTHEPEASADASQFSPELVDAVARRVVELMSDRAVREIAWEVVPDLAERLIRERIEKENTRSQEP
jgi:CheY-like chemotaxis protein